jgi:hypothetical protein
MDNLIFRQERSFVKVFENLSEDKVTRNALEWVCISRGVGKDVNRKIYTVLPSLPLVLNNGAWKIHLFKGKPVRRNPPLTMNTTINYLYSEDNTATCFDY